MKVKWHTKGTVCAGVTMKDRQAPENGNMALHVCQDEQAVLCNRKDLEKETLPLTQWALPWQKHTANIQKVSRKDAGKGSTDKNTSIMETDAVYTREKRLLIGVFTADCVGIALTSPDLAACIHSGWRGTAQAITWKTLMHLIQEEGLDMAQCSAWFSPSLMQDSLEVGMEVIEALESLREIGIDPQEFYYTVGEKAYLDNQGLNARMLLNAGVRPENIHLSHQDTKTEETCFSYRNEGKKTGEHFTFAWLA